MTDVVVVGGGPAGSVTALLLARSGYDVQLFDRQQFPRPKACGDCISPGANPILLRLGLWDKIVAAAPARLEGWTLTYDATSFSAGFTHFAADARTATALSISRAQFDNLLLDAARSAGVRLHTGTRVTGLLRDGKRITGIRVHEDGDRDVAARLVVGADGLRSFVAHQLKASAGHARVSKFSLTAHVRGLPDPRARGSMSLSQGVCLGIAPVEDIADPLFNVTVVLSSAVRRARGPHDLLRDALTQIGRADIARLIGDDVEILASGPFDSPVRRTVFDGAALVGDAVGYFDPFTGQGIYQGMASAELLAEHVCNAFAGTNAMARELEYYARRRDALIAPVHRLQRTIDYVCAHPAIAGMAFRTLSRSQPFADALVGVTSDLARPRALLNPKLLATLRPALRPAAR